MAAHIALDSHVITRPAARDPQTDQSIPTTNYYTLSKMNQIIRSVEYIIYISSGDRLEDQSLAAAGAALH
jgi:hypothetical protein